MGVGPTINAPAQPGCWFWWNEQLDRDVLAQARSSQSLLPRKSNISPFPKTASPEVDEATIDAL
jgi:hypothetical protein